MVAETLSFTNVFKPVEQIFDRTFRICCGLSVCTYYLPTLHVECEAFIYFYKQTHTPTELTIFKLQIENFASLIKGHGKYIAISQWKRTSVIKTKSL